jgi:hypothetical protein
VSAGRSSRLDAFKPFLDGLQFVCDHRGRGYIVMWNGPNPYLLRIGSRSANAVIRGMAHLRLGWGVSGRDLADINDYLLSLAERAGVVTEIWSRVAPAAGGRGVVIDVGNAEQTRVRITAGKVEILASGCPTLFYRSPTSLPMCMPAATGDLNLLKRYFRNLDPQSIVLVVAWITYVLAHPKLSTAKYPILVVQGGQGTGKSTVSRVILAIVDPSVVGPQLSPQTPRELAIAAQNAHVLIIDNLRRISDAMSDAFCVASTGGALSARKLYSDDEQQVIPVHVAIVLNGIHDFIDQSDLAQRCLPLRLRPLSGAEREPEADLFARFQSDLPAIMHGLFDGIAAILAHLPRATVTHPSRMIEFSRWLAALELAWGVEPGVYQAEYARAVEQGQRDTLLSHPLAAAILEFAETRATWTGTPVNLLAELNHNTTRETTRSFDWPKNPIALSKRLVSLQAALQSQGIRLELHRGKHRLITIERTNP